MSVFTKIMVIAISSALLNGCLNFSFSDDDEDDSTSNPAEATTGFSGKVADGYLTGAKVCLDLNSNKVCDSNEPSTMSTAGGEFSLTDVTQAQLDSAPLLVEIIVGETIDEDKPDLPITKKYTLTAPAGYEFISPLTTMVQNEIEENDLTPEEAEGAIQAKLGTTLDLEADYVEGAAEGNADAEEFDRLHKVAQVTVVVLQENIELVEDVLGDTQVSFEDLVAIIVQEVVTSLDTIADQVDSAIETEENGGDAFDPSSLADSEELDVVDVDTTTIEEEIEERETARETAAVNIAQVLESGAGLHFFDVEREFDAGTQQETLEYYYSTVIKNATSALVTISDTFYNPEATEWQQDQDNSSASNETSGEGRLCLLSNGTVSCIAEDDETITISGDSVIVEMAGVEATRQEITGISVDLTGKDILTFIKDEYFRVVDPMASFTPGAIGYKLSFNRPNAMYAIYDENAESISQCWGGNVEVNDNGAWTPTDTLCNNVFLHTGDGDHETDGVPVVNLSDLTTATAAVEPKDVRDIKGVRIDGSDGYDIIAEFVAGGQVNYYLFKNQYHGKSHDDSGTESKIQQANNEQNAMLEVVVSAEWNETEVAGHTIIQYAIPPLLAEIGNVDDEERLRFFVAYQGAVRRGDIQPVGEESDNEWVFNDAGLDQVKAAFDFSLNTPLEPCITGDIDLDNNNEAELGASYQQFSDRATTDCAASAFSAADVTARTWVTDFGFLTFDADGKGTFLGEVGEDDKAVLDFTWAINNDGFLVVNAQARIEDDLEGINVETVFLRLTLAKIEMNARQISVKSFSQEAGSAAALETVNGAIFGEVWGIN